VGDALLVSGFRHSKYSENFLNKIKLIYLLHRSKMVEALFLLRLLTLEAFFMLNTLSLIGSSSTLNASKLSLIALVSVEVNID
jgi:hypothetical protein